MLSIQSRLRLPTGQKLYIILALLSAAVTWASFLIQGRIGFSLWDEGYLWYGTQRVLMGEVPIRDFMAYDPARYYFSAAVMGLRGDNGIVSLRIAAFIFQGLGLFLALVVIVRSWDRPDALSMFSALAIILLWMFLQYKSFDITPSIAMIAALAYLIQRPSSRSSFIAGFVVGAAALFGRNHGLYGAIGCIAAIGCLRVFSRSAGKLFHDLFWWGAGVLAGYSPMLLALAFVPGMAAAIVDGIRFVMECQCTNLATPVPWPWRTVPGIAPYILTDPASLAAFRVVLGSFFIALPLFGIVGIGYSAFCWVKNNRIPPAAAAASFLALPYAHYSFSRADTAHLSLGIFPLIIGVLTVFSAKSAKVRIGVAALLVFASLVVVGPFQPRVISAVAKWKKVEIGRDTMRTDPWTAHNLELLSALDKKYCPNRDLFLAVPFWPGAYAAFERKSPMYEIYALFPRSNEFQQMEIERIREAAPAFALILDLPLDSRDDLRFQNTHPLVDRYIKENFEPVDEPLAVKPFYVYKARQSGR